MDKFSNSRLDSLLGFSYTHGVIKQRIADMTSKQAVKFQAQWNAKAAALKGKK